MAQDGLAAQMAGPQMAPQAPQGGGMQGAMPTVEEVVALLMQGIPPEELLQMGVPEEMIMQAIALLEQEMAAQQQAVPQEQQGGLAAQSLGLPA